MAHVGWVGLCLRLVTALPLLLKRGKKHNELIIHSWRRPTPPTPPPPPLLVCGGGCSASTSGGGGGNGGWEVDDADAKKVIYTRVAA